MFLCMITLKGAGSLVCEQVCVRELDKERGRQRHTEGITMLFSWV